MYTQHTCIYTHIYTNGNMTCMHMYLHIYTLTHHKHMHAPHTYRETRATLCNLLTESVASTRLTHRHCINLSPFAGLTSVVKSTVNSHSNVTEGHVSPVTSRQVPRMYVCVYICMYVRIYVCMYKCTCVRTFVRMHICVYVSMCICVYM